MEIADVVLSIDTSDYFVLDDELIVFSRAKQEYFGIGGAARLVFDALVEAKGGATVPKIEQLVGGPHELTSAEATLIREAIGLLVQLGVLHER